MKVRSIMSIPFSEIVANHYSLSPKDYLNREQKQTGDDTFKEVLEQSRKELEESERKDEVF